MEKIDGSAIDLLSLGKIRQSAINNTRIVRKKANVRLQPSLSKHQFKPKDQVLLWDATRIKRMNMKLNYYWIGTHYLIEPIGSST